VADPPAYPGVPRWVKVLGAIALVVLLLFIHRMLTGRGGHGGMHGRAQAPSSGAAHGHRP
jgi:hypothetical protein